MNNLIVIEIDNEQAIRLKAIYENDVQEAKNKISEWQTKLISSSKMLETITSKLNGKKANLHQTPLFIQGANKEENPATKYNNKWSAMEKVKFVLQQNQKAMTLARILDYIRIYEPNIGTGIDLKYRRMQAGFSAGMKGKIDKKKDFQRLKSDSGDFLYGFIEWFNDDGTLKHDFK